MEHMQYAFAKNTSMNIVDAYPKIKDFCVVFSSYI